MASLTPRKGFRWLLCEHPWCTRRATRKVRVSEGVAEVCARHLAFGQNVASMRAEEMRADTRCDAERFGDYCGVCECGREAPHD